jgi:hypothetical protein
MFMLAIDELAKQDPSILLNNELSSNLAEPN